METTITLRIPVELKEKLDRISGGKRAEWVRRQIEAASLPAETGE